MKTDTLFYELFQATPQTFFELLQITPTCPYRFESITVKASEKRIDGVFAPTMDDQPIYFLEVQGFPDEVIYFRALLANNEHEVRENVVQWVANVRQTPDLDANTEEKLIAVMSQLIEQKFRRWQKIESL